MFLVVCLINGYGLIEVVILLMLWLVELGEMLVLVVDDVYVLLLIGSVIGLWVVCIDGVVVDGVGELLFGGVCVVCGYYGCLVFMVECFVFDVDGEFGVCVYCIGDLVCLCDDGVYDYLGCFDD